MALNACVKNEHYVDVFVSAKLTYVNTQQLRLLRIVFGSFAMVVVFVLEI
ncbi:MAG: hypothetical protein K0R08_785 [Solimicrobium sp.]|jgi:hypothetical protein|nr:hypothetical protein [Solimicrobium sp.]